MQHPAPPGASQPARAGGEYLVCVSGPLEGLSISIDSEELTFGRATENAIVIQSGLVSRRHCVLALQSGGWVLRDLQSANGTYVNGRQIEEQALVAGDYIGVGPCRFILLAPKEETVSPRAPVWDTHMIDPQAMREYHNANLVSAPDQAVDGFFESSREFIALRSLLRAASAFNGSLDPVTIATRLLESAVSLLACESGAVLMPEEAGPGFEAIAVQHGPAGEYGAEEPPELPEALIRRVCTSGVAVITEAGVIAVPLATFQSVLGVLYVKSRVPERAQASWADERLRMASALGAIAGVALQNARSFVSLARGNNRRQKAYSLDHDLIGDSAAMRQVYEFIASASGTDSTVLIQGETGTGKELVARAIHRNGARRNGAFVAVNCAAITDSLFESEMFGHERGSFTGATHTKAGLFEQAAGGTLFLDEVGEMAMGNQAKLLRALQERSVRRIGGTKDITINVRIIAATNRSLAPVAQSGGFREDLFYRLNVLSLALVPLRERRDDILPLANYFVRKHRLALTGITGISAAARAMLLRHSWPGNVRELENAIERAGALSEGPELDPADFPGQVDEAVEHAPITAYQRHLAASKRELVLRTLRECNGNQSEAARKLGVHRNYVGRLLQTAKAEG